MGCPMGWPMARGRYRAARAARERAELADLAAKLAAEVVGWGPARWTARAGEAERAGWWWPMR